MPEKNVKKNRIPIQKFPYLTSLVLFALFMGCVVPAIHAIANYELKGGDVHYLYLAKIRFWFFPIGIWALINIYIRRSYSNSINKAYSLKIKTEPLTDEEQKKLHYAVKLCLAIKKIAALFLLFPNRHHPFNKEIELYFPSDKKQNFDFKKSVKKIFKVFLIVAIPVYVGLGIYSWIHTIRDWNYATSYPAITKTFLDSYIPYIKSSLQSEKIKDKINGTDFTNWESYNSFGNGFKKDTYLSDKYGTWSSNLNEWFIGNTEDTTQASVFQAQFDKIFNLYNQDVWSKNKTFEWAFYAKEFNPAKGSLAFYLRFRIYNEDEFDKLIDNDFKEISVYSTGYSQLFYLDNFIKNSSKESHINATSIEYNP